MKKLIIVLGVLFIGVLAYWYYVSQNTSTVYATPTITGEFYKEGVFIGESTYLRVTNNSEEAVIIKRVTDLQSRWIGNSSLGDEQDCRPVNSGMGTDCFVEYNLSVGDMVEIKPSKEGGFGGSVEVLVEGGQSKLEKVFLLEQ